MSAAFHQASPSHPRTLPSRQTLSCYTAAVHCTVDKAHPSHCTMYRGPRRSRRPHDIFHKKNPTWRRHEPDPPPRPRRKRASARNRPFREGSDLSCTYLAASTIRKIPQVFVNGQSHPEGPQVSKYLATYQASTATRSTTGNRGSIYETYKTNGPRWRQGWLGDARETLSTPPAACFCPLGPHEQGSKRKHIRDVYTTSTNRVDLGILAVVASESERLRETRQANDQL